MSTAAEELAREVARFRAWYELPDGSPRDWEYEYLHWPDIYSAAKRVLDERRELEAAVVPLLLYALARDHEAEFIRELLDEYRDHGLRLADAATRGEYEAEQDARWQLAVFLGRHGGPWARWLLRRYLDDPDEYVRRRALMAAAECDPEHAQEIAWARLRDPHEYTRLVAFTVLRDGQSDRVDQAAFLLRDDPSSIVRAEVEKGTVPQLKGPG